MNKSIKTEIAFTLIELLVVIAIIGILSALIVVGMNETTESANIAKSKVFSNSLRNNLALNIVGEWKFEGPTGAGQTVTTLDLQDSWGGHNSNIVINGTPIVKGGSDCVVGKCLIFNSSTDYVTCGNGGTTDLSVSSGDSLTIEVWVNINTLGRSHAIVSQWRPWIFFITTANKLNLYIRSNGGDISASANTALISNKWYHAAVVYTKANRTATFYLNGKSDGAPVFATEMDSLTTGRVQVGGYGNLSNLLSGKVDDFRIYNTAIPTSQIQQNYFAGLNKMFAGNQINQIEYNQRITELVNNYAKE
ncbi:MAG: LamG-like jellyroll fold domain-containing protein [Candidatus Paceibacterota bacterium]